MYQLPVRVPIDKHTRFYVLERDGFACVYCGRKVPAVQLEIDHVTALIDGGTNDIGNLVTACHECNHGKAGKKLTCMPLSLQQRITQAMHSNSDETFIQNVQAYWCKTVEPMVFDVKERLELLDFRNKGVTRQQLKWAIDDTGQRLRNQKMDVLKRPWGYFCAACIDYVQKNQRAKGNQT